MNRDSSHEATDGPRPAGDGSPPPAGLLAGRRLGRYEILGALGAGGMGEVYRARDTVLDRTVAIKVMPPHLAADADARRRFEREARAISALQHPHICALHDVGSDGAVEFLVMELVEGETLAARIARGPLPLAEALRVAAQIADALDRAHRQGIVHRDLKPGNVMLGRGGAKLLDFGLARHVPPLVGGSLSAGPTRGETLTAAGAIVGTLQYMAPEQLEGGTVDARTDIFAFGAVLYEMLTGTRAFAGSSPASVIGAILRETPPPVSARAPLAPPALDALVGHCLAKDVEARWQSAHDLRLELDIIATGASVTQPVATATAAAPRRAVAWLLVVALPLLGALGGWLLARQAPPAPPPLRRLVLPHPTGGAFGFSVEAVTLALSPDGSALAYVDKAPSGTSVWLRPLAESTARQLPGTEGARSIFWSPDGRELGFVTGGKLSRVAVAGGAPIVICDVDEDNGIAATWGRDAILFSSIQGETLYSVTPSGGRPTVALQVDARRGEQRFLWPWFLPDGQRFLFLTTRTDGTAELRLGGPGAPPRAVAQISSRAELVAPDWLVFVRDGSLLAQRLDLRRAALTGAPQVLSAAVRGFGTTGAASFATARDGTVVVATAADLDRLTLIGADGRALGTIGDATDTAGLAVSPDGERALLARMRPGILTYDIWQVDLARQVESRLTDEAGSEISPLFVPGSRDIVYSASERGMPNLVRRDLDSGRTSWLTRPSPVQFPAAVTPDGARVIFREGRTGGGALLAVATTGGTASPIASGLLARGATLSPDGRLLAYVSIEPEGPELFVRPMAGGEAQLVSRAAVLAGRFGADGRTLFFTTRDGRVDAVPVSGSPRLDIGTAVNRFAQTGLGWTSFEVLPDGRFLALVREVDGSRQPLLVISGWRPSE